MLTFYQISDPDDEREDQEQSADNENGADDPRLQPLTVRPAMRMLQCVYPMILKDLVWRGTEKGGLLLGPRKSDLITAYLPDRKAVVTAGTYRINSKSLNGLMGNFRRTGHDIKGIVHMHPRGVRQPSGGDLYYLRQLFGNPKHENLDEFAFPIVCDGQLYPYIVTASNLDRVFTADLVLV